MVLPWPLADTIMSNSERYPMKDVLVAIHSRKSVRRYADKSVEREQLEELLKSGMAAPSAGNRQPWAFIVLTQREKLVAISQKLPYGKILANAGAAIVVCGVLSKALPKDERDFWVQDCSAVSQNILLTAEAMGLGGTWLGVYPMSDRVKNIQSLLTMPEDIIPLNIISLGYPSGAEKPKMKFNPANIHWENW